MGHGIISAYLRCVGNAEATAFLCGIADEKELRISGISSGLSYNGTVCHVRLAVSEFINDHVVCRYSEQCRRVMNCGIQIVGIDFIFQLGIFSKLFKVPLS